MKWEISLDWKSENPFNSIPELRRIRPVFRFAICDVNQNYERVTAMESKAIMKSRLCKSLDSCLA